VADLLDQHTEMTTQLGVQLDEAAVNAAEAPIDAVESPVDGAEALVEIGAKLRVHAGTLPDAPAVDNVALSIRFATPRKEEIP
jgi:hypothetical protein